MTLSRALISSVLIFQTFSSWNTLAATHHHKPTASHHALAVREELISTPTQPATAGIEIPSPLGRPASPCSGVDCITPSAIPEILPCDAANGASLVAGNEDANYTITCDIDYPSQNIYPFVPAGSFKECLAQCEIYNLGDAAGSQCRGFVFAPERVHEADNCYLKSSLNDPVSATIHLVGATLVSLPTTCTSETASGR